MKEVKIYDFFDISRTNPENYLEFSQSSEEEILLAFLQLRYITLFAYSQNNYDWESTLDNIYIQQSGKKLLADLEMIFSHCADLCEENESQVRVRSALAQHSELLPYLDDLATLCFAHYRERKKSGLEAQPQLRQSSVIRNFIHAQQQPDQSEAQQ